MNNSINNINDLATANFSSQNLWDAASEQSYDGGQSKSNPKVLRAEDVTTIFVLGSKAAVSHAVNVFTLIPGCRVNEFIKFGDPSKVLRYSNKNSEREIHPLNQRDINFANCKDSLSSLIRSLVLFIDDKDAIASADDKSS